MSDLPVAAGNKRPEAALMPPGMTFVPGWDAVQRRSLKFVNDELERAYEARAPQTRRDRQRRTFAGTSALFLCVAVLGPTLAGLPVLPSLAFGVTGAALSGLLILLPQYARTSRQLDLLAVANWTIATVILLELWTYTGTMPRFGAASLMLGSILAFGTTRYPFRLAVLYSVFTVAAYFAFAFAQGLTLVFDGAMVGVAVAIGSAATYVAERTNRRLFAQGLVVDDLNRRVNELLHSYLAPEVADTLIADPARATLGGEEVNVTVLFADLTGYTAFSEKVRPEEAMAMLNSAFSAAVPVVLEEGGTIVQFAGDAMMVIFNAPVRQADHARRAARAALRLQVATAAAQGDGGQPRFRVGVNTGLALVGNVGSAELRNFTAIGDTTNMAARLQALAAPGSVVIGEPTRQLLGEGAEVRSLGLPELKGKSLPVPVYELVALRES